MRHALRNLEGDELAGALAYEEWRASRPLPERTTYVYRAFEAFGPLLYIGITHDVDARMRQHRRSSPWFQLADHITVAQYRDRATAARVEANAIVRERPTDNGVIESRLVDPGFTFPQSTSYVVALHTGRY